MKSFVKKLIITFLIILVILNSAEVILQSYCLSETLKKTGPHLFEGTAADFAIYVIVFSVNEVILLAAIIRLFANKSVQSEKNTL